MDLQERLTAFAMLGATWVMWLLVALSILCVAIILERAYYLLASRDNLLALREDLVKFLKDKNIAGARERLARSRSLEARVVVAGLDSYDEGAASVEHRLSGAASMARLQMERN